MLTKLWPISLTGNTRNDIIHTYVNCVDRSRSDESMYSLIVIVDYGLSPNRVNYVKQNNYITI